MSSNRFTSGRLLLAFVLALVLVRTSSAAVMWEGYNWSPVYGGADATLSGSDMIVPLDGSALTIPGPFYLRNGGVMTSDPSLAALTLPLFTVSVTDPGPPGLGDTDNVGFRMQIREDLTGASAGNSKMILNFGAFAGLGNYYLDLQVFEGVSGAWAGRYVHTFGTRTAGLHTLAVQRDTGDNLHFYFDMGLVHTIGPLATTNDPTSTTGLALDTAFAWDRVELGGWLLDGINNPPPITSSVTFHSFSAASVPEPSTTVMVGLALGLVGVGRLRRRT